MARLTELEGCSRLCSPTLCSVGGRVPIGKLEESKGVYWSDTGRVMSMLLPHVYGWKGPGISEPDVHFVEKADGV